MRKLIKLILILALIAVIAFGGLVAMICIKRSNIPQTTDYDAIVVLGAQVKPDGSLSLQLKYRLEAAYEAWQKHPCLIVTCGGQGNNEPAPEGQVMRDYLISLGVPEESIVADTVSENTKQNMQQAKALLTERGLTGKICVVTSDYHLPRAMAIAQDAQLTATGVPAVTLPEFWIKNYSREALAWVKYWAQKYLGL